jgi:uncharacterized membrane protein YeaQ/YmgE (transglycosylase-associated protein family)
MLVNILVWALFGLLAGIVAKFLDRQPGPSIGIVFTILLGIAGAVVGGFIATQLFKWDIETFSLPGFAVAVGGALLLLIVYRLVMSSRRSA